MIAQIKKHSLMYYVVFLLVVKIILVCNLPIYFISGAGHDDLLMLKHAVSLVNLKWLGSYSSFTLIKGAFFPMFLSVMKGLAVPYLIAITMFYHFGCYIFVRGIKDVFKKPIYKFVLFTALVFNPVSFSIETFQRAYRSALTPAQVLIIMGCLFAIYLRLEQPAKKLVPWLVLAGLALASMWLTREDSIWILPFVLGSIGVTMGVLIHSYRKDLEKESLKKAFMCIIPIVILIVSTLMVSAVNYRYYGVFTTNEISNSNFTKVLKSLYSVKPMEDIAYVSVPRSTFVAIYKVSPTLNSIYSELEMALDKWDKNSGRLSGDGEIEDGWLMWALRDGVEIAGYYKNAQRTDQFYLDVHNEIQKAIADGKLESRSTMPSALMSPWRKSYPERLAKAVIYTFRFVASYERIVPQLLKNADTHMSYSNTFEWMTNSNLIFHSDEDYTPNRRLDNVMYKLDTFIAKAYEVTGLPLFILSLVGFMYLTLLIILKKWRTQYVSDIWLITMSMLLSMVMLFLGISYTHISAYNAISPLYLSGIYPIMTAFELLIIIFVIQDLLQKFKGKKADEKGNRVKV